MQPCVVFLELASPKILKSRLQVPVVELISGVHIVTSEAATRGVL